MFISRFFSIFLGITVLALPGIILAETPSITTPNRKVNNETDRLLQKLCWRYNQELPHVKQSKNQASLLSWEKELKNALANQEACSVYRSRAMNALGTIQVALGKKKEAVKTYHQIEKDAQKAGDLFNQVSSGKKQLDLLDPKSTKTILRSVRRFEVSAKQLTKQKKDDASKRIYVDILSRSGSLLMDCAKTTKHAAKSKKILNRARNLLKKSISMPNHGTVPLSLRMYWLAQTQSMLGLHAEAASIYDKLAKMPNTGFSRLWMEYLRICETTKRDSPEYRSAIESSLANFHERGGTDDYEVTLRRLLGQSYRNVKDYEQSTKILSAVAEKGNDQDTKAHDLLLMAQNSRDAKNIGAAYEILEEIKEKYPETGVFQTAEVELEKNMYQSYVFSDPKFKYGSSFKGILIGINLMVIFAIAVIIIRKQMKEKKLS